MSVSVFLVDDHEIVRHGLKTLLAAEDDLTVVEVDSEKGEEKPRYSKLSVWLMVLYSGLAIGSDG